MISKTLCWNTCVVLCVVHVTLWFWWWKSWSMSATYIVCWWQLFRVLMTLVKRFWSWHFIPMVLDDGIKKKYLKPNQSKISSLVLELLNQAKELEDLKLWYWSMKAWRCENVKTRLIRRLGFFLVFITLL